MCDLAVAADTASFAVSGINLGLFCATPSVPLSRNMHRKQALEMLLTGEFIDAATALARGLVNRVVPMADLDAALAKMCVTIAAKSPEAVAAGKRLFYKQIETGVVEAYSMASETMACNAVLPEARAGIAKFTRKA
jgi:enoyl-CoA hydratase/carnithine racemase